MWKSGIPLALIVGAVVGLLAALLISIYGDEGTSDSNVSASMQTNDKGVGPGGDWAAPNATLDGNRLKYQGTSKHPQSQFKGTIRAGEDAAQAKESHLPLASEFATEIHGIAKSTEAVVPFRASWSIQERCRTHPAPTADSCREVIKLLEEMSREERDAEWATRTELRIRAVVAAREDGTQIRALECKMSLCAVETLSPGHDHLGILRQVEQESAGVMDDGDFVLAWEQDPTQGKVTITARIFSRRVQ